MTFLAPLGLLALLTLPVILILHFRRERLRRVAVPSLMLWQHLAPATGTQRKLMLPLTLLLLLHLLIAALLALALSRPQWLGELLGSNQEQVIVILDTSTSMAAQESFNTTRLDQAREHVRTLIDNLGGAGHFALISVDSQARLLAAGGVGNRAALLAALDDLQATGTSTDLGAALTLARVVQESQQQSGRVVIISDMEPPQDASLPLEQVEWLRVGDTTDNRAVVTLAAQPQRGGAGGYDVYARIANYDDRSAVATLRLFGDDELINTRMLDLQASGETELTWSLPGGIGILRAELDGNDALPADDSARISLEQSRPINAVLVSQGSVALQRVLGAIDGLNLAVVPPGDYGASSSAMAARADLTIFDGFLPDEWPIGGVLVVDPQAGEHPLLSVEAAPETASDDEGQSVLSFLPPRLKRIPNDDGSDPLDGLSLSGVDFGPLPRVQPPDWARVQVQADGKPLMLRGQTGESEIAIWAFDPAQGNLAGKLAFPLLVARTVQDLTLPPPPESLMVGQSLTFQPNPRTEMIELREPDDEVRQMPISSTLIIEGLNQPGLYTLIEYADDEVIYEGGIAVNAGTPLESDLSPRPLPAVSTPYLALDEREAEQDDDGTRNDQQPLWPWLSLAALVLLLLEWVYVHWR